jgi:hypothetical protein
MLLPVMSRDIVFQAQAGLSLDSACQTASDGSSNIPCFDASGNDISLISKRDSGMQLVFNIIYSNSCRVGSFCIIPLQLQEADVMYEASVSWLSGTGFSDHISQLGQQGVVESSRLVNKMAGIRVTVSQSGGVLVPDVATAGVARVKEQLPVSFGIGI